MNVIRPVTIGDTGAFTRASTKLFIGSDGTLQSSPVDVPAFQYDLADLAAAPIALLEFAATNAIRNNSMQGAVAGTPGTSPNNWSITAAASGISPSVVGVGVESGIDYIDVSFTGTAAAAINFMINMESFTQQAAVQGQSWTASAYVRKVSGSSPSQLFRLAASGRTAAGAVNEEAFINLASTTSGLIGQRPSVALAIVSATTAFVSQYLQCGFANGEVANLVLRIGLPQLELGALATSAIRTTAAAATRSADVVTGTGLIWSSLFETAPAAYAAGTTYGYGVYASVAGVAGLITVYRSLQANNLGHTPVSSPTWWVNAGITYQVYSGAATYALNDRVISPMTHKVYISLVAGNIGQALTDATKWFDDGATNRWAFLDNIVGTVSTAPVPVHMLLGAGAIDSLSLLNMTATAMALGMIDVSLMRQVYSKKQDLTEDLSITDYDSYFFEEPVTVSDMYTDGLPPYYSGMLSVALMPSAGTAALGVAKFGNNFDLGGSRYGMRVGFISYTKKVTDSKGNTSVKKGANSKRMTVTTMIDNKNLDKTIRVMAALDGIPTVYVGAGNLYTAAIMLAFTKDFDTEISYPTRSLCSFTQEGLT